MKQYLISLRSRLATVTSLKHIDTDWGQLNFEQPPVQYPCALISVSTDRIAQVKPSHLRIHAKVNITIAKVRYTSTIRDAATALTIFDTIDSVVDQLQDWSDGRFSQLQLDSISPVGTAPGFDAYMLTFNTGYEYICEPDTEPVQEPEEEPEQNPEPNNQE